MLRSVYYFHADDGFADPPSSNVTLDDVIYLGPAFQNTTVREVMSPTSGRFCYLYD